MRGNSFFLIAVGALLQIGSLAFDVGQKGYPNRLIAVFVSGLAVWLFGVFFQRGFFRIFLVLLPFFLPFLGPVFWGVGFWGYHFSRRNTDLFLQTEFIEYDSHLVLPGIVASPAEMLARIRHLQPAGDILKGDDLALKQSVLALIGQEVSENVVRLLQGAKNDMEDEIRLIAATLLTRVERAYQEEIERLKSLPASLERDRLLGLAYFAYADSGLLVESLRLREIRMGIPCFGEVLREGGNLDQDLLLRISREAIIAGDEGFLSLVRGISSGPEESNIGEIIDMTECYEKKDYMVFFRKAAQSKNESIRKWYQALSKWEVGVCKS